MLTLGLIILSLAVASHALDQASSCMDAKDRSLKNAAGTTGSGTFNINGQDMYCDQETVGGGWTLVANQANTGSWIPVDLDLDPSKSYGTYSASWDHTSYYYTPFTNVEHSEMMFKVGDATAYCVVAAAEMYRLANDPYNWGQDVLAKNTRVIASAGTAVQACQLTNNLYRKGVYAEDQWFGCAGNHWDNTRQMLWGEIAYGAYYAYKNAHLGVGLFVRSPSATVVEAQCGAASVCATDNGGCDPLAKCTELATGAVHCKCPDGYEDNGTGGLICLAPDSNSCDVNNGGCHENAICVQNGADRSCLCKGGFEGDGILECTPCAIGYYKAADGNQECSACAVGKIAPSTGSTACALCPSHLSSMAGTGKCNCLPSYPKTGKCKPAGNPMWGEDGASFRQRFSAPKALNP